MNTTIGIVLATYNGELYIRHQLETIINQTMKPNLIVVSDGGSNDHTIDICHDVLKKCGIDYMILSTDDHLSVQANFNKALYQCKCDYIFFSDQDDSWKRNKIEITIKSMMKVHASFAFTNARITDGVLNESGLSLWDSIGFFPKHKVEVYPPKERGFIEELIKHNIVTGMTMCITSDLREVVLPLSQFAIHDKWIAMIAAHYCTTVAINEELVLYRQHSNNEVGTKRSLKRAINNKKKYIDNIIDRASMIRNTVSKLLGNGIESPFDFSAYLDYLDKRLQFVQKNQNITSILRMITDYRRYEKKSSEIILKDIIVRIAP